jgi:hypothetical protein
VWHHDLQRFESKHSTMVHCPTEVTAQGQQHVVRPGVQTSTSTPSPITRLLARIEDWPLRVSKKVAHRIDAAVRLEDNNAAMPPAVRAK